jgi:hypothetical protein
VRGGLGLDVGRIESGPVGGLEQRLGQLVPKAAGCALARANCAVSKAIPAIPCEGERMCPSRRQLYHAGLQGCAETAVP